MTAVAPADRLCRICGAPASLEIHAREMMFGTHERFDYVACADCGCLQIADIPADLQRFYPPDYHRRISHAAAPGPLKRLARRLVAQHLRLDPGDRIGLGRIMRRHPALRHYA